MVKIGFDISQLAHTGGVVTYTQSLAEHLSKRSDIELSFFYSSLRKPYKGNLLHVHSLPIPPTLLELFFNRIRIIPMERLLGDVDIYHSSDWIQPPTKAKKVTTYHDIVPLKYPQWSHPKVVAVHKRRLSLVEKEIDCVIAVSEATKKDLIELSNIPREKIVVIYEAAGGQFRPQSEEKIGEFKEKYDLPEEFVLAIGGVGERRNLAQVKEATKDYHLVISGQTLPWLPSDELPLLYTAAKVLLYPSYYEGFGLPVLEAMACGTPVITSNISSMPEVGGEAALYVDPTKVGDIEKVLNQVMRDDNLRKTMIDQGFKQSAKFSWDKCSEETVKVYKSLLR